MQSSLSQPSMMLSGPSLHSYPGVQAPELGKPQSSLAYQQPSSTQHIPILFEPQLNQPSGMGGSQLIDTHLLQVTRKMFLTIFFLFSVCVNCFWYFLWMIQARQGMNQHSNLYSGQVQQHGQSSYYSNTQSPSSAMQQVKTNNCYANLDLVFIDCHCSKYIVVTLKLLNTQITEYQWTNNSVDCVLNILSRSRSR